MKDRRDKRGTGRGRWMLSGLAILLCLPAFAQVYKWTDDKGTVHYTDTPPPARKASQLKTPLSGASAQAPLPYELARAVKASPVTLYTTSQIACAGCEQGRALLRARGIPFTEKTVNTDEDKEQMRQLSGALDLPLLVVGSRKLAGFQATAWQDALSAAAYPRSAQLPRGYQYAAPEAAAQASASVPAPPTRAKTPAPAGDDAATQAAEQAAEQRPRRPAQKPRNAPPGFQF